jgi:RNA polymerase sigma-70 factor (ECF subfamily)
MKQSLDEWFSAQILPHEAGLMRYLRRVWTRSGDLPDLRQETYARVYESARKSLPRSPKGFLFTTARNLVADRVRRERVVSIQYTQDPDSLNFMVDELSPDRRLSARQELQRLADAYARLSEMTRAAIWLRRVEGLSQREAAERLGIQEGALESHLYRGLQSMANALGGLNPGDAGEQSGD